MNFSMKKHLSALNIRMLNKTCFYFLCEVRGFFTLNCKYAIDLPVVTDFLTEGKSVCFLLGWLFGSFLSLDTSLLISFNQPIMYCQPHSGILIGTLSQATLLPPPMSPHVENPHSMSWRNRECQVTIFFLFFYPCCEDWLGARAFFFSSPTSPHPLFSLSFFFFGFPRSPFLQSMTSWGRSWTTVSWFRVQSGAGGRPPHR